MSFNRRGPDRPRDRSDRPQRRFDRPPRPPGGEWQPRERPERGERGDRDRQFGQRSDRPYPPRPRPEGPRDEGGMSIRLDPRRLGTLKQLAAEAGARPGELVQIWIEERIDSERRGDAQRAVGPGGSTDELRAELSALAARVAALEGRAEPSPSEATPEETSANGDRPKRRRNAVSARPSGERVALHDEIIAVLGERGPQTAAELASAIVERGRYSPPRSGKPLDALTVNARVSNPTYRARFTRSDGRIGLAEAPAEGSQKTDATAAEPSAEG